MQPPEGGQAKASKGEDWHWVLNNGQNTTSVKARLQRAMFRLISGLFASIRKKRNLLTSCP